MCGRFNVISDPLTQLLVEITGQKFNVDTQLNTAPTEQTPVLLKTGEGQWDLRSMRWWLVPYWAKEPTTKYAMFNAKSETLSSSRAFKEPFERRRCVLPVSGYYEWKRESGVKVPYYIEPKNDSGFALAALWDRWQGTYQVIESCTIVTAAAPPTMHGIHHRIPVHLAMHQVEEWVGADTTPDTLQSLLQPEVRVPLQVSAMSTYVNNARNKDERCLEILGDTTFIHGREPQFPV